MSWQGETIEPGETILRSFVLTWGVGSEPPAINLEATAIPGSIFWEDTFTIAGSVTDDSPSASIIIVFNNDLRTLVVLPTKIVLDDTGTGQISIPVRLEDCNIREGKHTLDVYAVDCTGEISDPWTFNVVCVAPSPVESRTRSMSYQATVTSTISVSETPTSTPYPTLTPYVDIQMHVPLDLDSRTNFRFQGLRHWLPNDPIEISATGFVTRYIVGGRTGFLTRLQRAEVDGTTISTVIDTYGPAGIVQFVIENSGDTVETVSLAVTTDLLIDWNRRSEVSKRSNSSGIQVVSGLTHFQVVCRHSPVVTDVDSFWFGPAFAADDFLWTEVAESKIEADDLAFTFAWRNKAVPAHGRLVLAVMMVWGDDLTPPNASISDVPKEDRVIEWEEEISLNGTIEGNVTIHLIIDGKPVQVTLPKGGTFSVTFSAAALQLAAGTHLFVICAIDETGAVTTIASFQNEVVAPTAPQTSTPLQSRTPTPTASVSATWGELAAPVWDGDDQKSGLTIEGAQIVIGAGIPVGLILILGFSVLLCRYRRAMHAEMRQSLKSGSMSDASGTGMGI
jgi:hypothetical protein